MYFYTSKKNVNMSLMIVVFIRNIFIKIFYQIISLLFTSTNKPKTDGENMTKTKMTR